MVRFICEVNTRTSGGPVVNTSSMAPAGSSTKNLQNKAKKKRERDEELRPVVHLLLQIYRGLSKSKILCFPICQRLKSVQSCFKNVEERAELDVDT